MAIIIVRSVEILITIILPDFMKISAKEKLERFYEKFSGEDQVLILINADPDAMAAAMAVKRLLWRKVAGVAISNINVIKRPDNLAMIRLLDINLIHVDQVDPSRFTRFVMVDSQPNHHESFLKFKFTAIIDHHPDTSPDAPFQDIRPTYGATASMMTEYLRAAKIKPSTKLATGLFFAIKNDTSNFERQTLIEDLRAFQFLFHHANPILARKIEQAEIPINFLKYYKLALNTMKRRKNRVFVHLGNVVNPDICVLIADFYMRVNDVTWSIVSGLYQNRLIVVFRNDGIRKNAGKVAKASLGGFGSAGGHKSMARAEIPIADIADKVDIKDEKKMMNWIIRQIEHNAGKK
jgi:nanoRNase/pAp phosphatase (c-di-AMP/oligoRNAs hydrolase)